MGRCLLYASLPVIMTPEYTNHQMMSKFRGGPESVHLSPSTQVESETPPSWRVMLLLSSFLSVSYEPPQQPENIMCAVNLWTHPQWFQFTLYRGTFMRVKCLQDILRTPFRGNFSFVVQQMYLFVYFDMRIKGSGGEQRDLPDVLPCSEKRSVLFLHPSVAGS